jgi:hypothetical protein
MIPASTANRTFVMPDLAKAWSWTRRNGPSAGLEVLVNFALPYLAYKLAKSSLGDVGALMAASAPPIAWSIREFARHRRVDALSILALFGLALSLLAFIGGGGARFLQLREQLVFVAIGLVFLGSAAIGKPLIYLLARARIKRRSLAEAQSFESMRDNPAFRRAMVLMTLAWGTSLVVEASISCALLFALTIEQYLLVSPIMGYSALGALTAWTFWYAKRAIGRIRAQRE